MITDKKCEVCGKATTHRISKEWKHDLTENKYPEAKCKITLDKNTCVFCIQAIVAEMTDNLHDFYIEGKTRFEETLLNEIQVTPTFISSFDE